MTSDKRKPPTGGGADADTRNNQPPKSYTEPPIIRDGVYARPLPLHRSGLSPESWRLRDQWWVEIHLARLAGAWDRMYREGAA
jgi:hypothetical protein